MHLPIHLASRILAQILPQFIKIYKPYGNSLLSKILYYIDVKINHLFDT